MKYLFENWRKFLSEEPSQEEEDSKKKVQVPYAPDYQPEDNYYTDLIDKIQKGDPAQPEKPKQAAKPKQAKKPKRSSTKLKISYAPDFSRNKRTSTSTRSVSKPSSVPIVTTDTATIKGPEQQKGMEKSDLEVSNKVKGIKIAAVGDSLTAGVPAVPRSYIDHLGGQKFAIGGKATYQLLGKVDQALQVKPEYLVIWMGTNNPFLGNRFGGCYDYNKMREKIIKDLGIAYKKTKTAGVKVIGISLPNPREKWQSKYNRCKRGKGKYCCPNSNMRDPVRLWKEFQKVNNWIKSNADIFIQLPGAPGSDAGYGKRNDAPADGIHVNNNYQRQIAALIQSKIGK